MAGLETALDASNGRPGAERLTAQPAIDTSDPWFLATFGHIESMTRFGLDTPLGTTEQRETRRRNAFT
jgi:hypothetical protein